MAQVDITRQLARYATGSSFEALPTQVATEAVRAFVNWLGCALGGCRDPSVAIALAVAADAGGSPQASIIGHGLRTDLMSAAFVNCLSSSSLAFDDTHLATVTHPTGPVASPLLALAERLRVPGTDFINALALGIELECRLSNALLLPPARSNVGFYITGLTGPIGAAAALGRVFRLDEPRMASALGLGAAQASGIRSTHGSMAGAVVPAVAARSGAAAALLAQKGFTCRDDALEAPNGFLSVYSTSADSERAVAGLGESYELLANAYKPYPCGIVIHAAIDACLEVAAKNIASLPIRRASIRVNPLALTLTDRRDPGTPMEAQVSLYHWVAAALLRGRAALGEVAQECIDDVNIVALRRDVLAVADDRLGRDEAIAEVTLHDGSLLQSHVRAARGSSQRPLTDEELDQKFLMQAELVLRREAAAALLHAARNITTMRNVGSELLPILSARSAQRDTAAGPALADGHRG
jgi:2-methylcitrate dehydratase PrpD